MFITQKITKAGVVSLFTLLFGVAGFNAHAIIITPSTSGIILGSSLTPPTGPSNCEPNCVYNAFNIDGGVNNGSLSLLYKSDHDNVAIGSDSGRCAASYQTTFSNTVSDPSNALVD